MICVPGSLRGCLPPRRGGALNRVIIIIIGGGGIASEAGQDKARKEPREKEAEERGSASSARSNPTTGRRSIIITRLLSLGPTVSKRKMTRMARAQVALVAVTGDPRTPLTQRHFRANSERVGLI